MQKNCYFFSDLKRWGNDSLSISLYKKCHFLESVFFYLVGVDVFLSFLRRFGVDIIDCMIPEWLHVFELFHGLLTLWSNPFSWPLFPSMWNRLFFPELWWGGGGVGVISDISSSSDNSGGFIPVTTNSANASTPYSDWSYRWITSIKNSIGLSPFGTFRPIRPKWNPTSFGDPWYMSWPRANMMRWSSRSKMRDDGWWMVRTTVLPVRAMLWTFSITLWALVESKPDVGSSRKSSDGPWMMSTPIDTLRRSPPETPRVPSSPIYVFLADYITKNVYKLSEFFSFARNKNVFLLFCLLYL